MQVYTNMAWPEDPYRTGQQLYSRPVPRLAAFTIAPPAGLARAMATSVAIVYLPLHRTQAMTVTGRTLAFGFRAASIADEAEAGDLAALADLDLLQARRHAAILAGYLLPDELGELRALLAGSALRGLSAVQQEWHGRHTPARGKAQMIDCRSDLPGNPSLEHARQRAFLMTSSAYPPEGPGKPAGPGLAVTLTVERALSIALVCARHLDRYRWEGTLDTGAILAAAAWDCLPQPGAGRPGEALSNAAAASRAQPGQSAATGNLHDHHE
jgi:hypothetical protein